MFALPWIGDFILAISFDYGLRFLFLNTTIIRDYSGLNVVMVVVFKVIHVIPSLNYIKR